MKNKILSVFAVMWILLCAALAYADVKPNIIVSGFGIREKSIDVGREFTLLINLSNTESSACAKSITTSIEAEFPFIMEGISTLSVGDLCYGSAKLVSFPMKVDPTANGGFYQIKATSNYQSSSYIQFSSSNSLNIFVNGLPDINANIINSEPVDLYPGDTGTLTVKVENNGNFQAQSLSMVMKAPKPLEAKWSKSFNSIEVLEPKQSRAVEFAVEVPKDAEAKAYPLEIDASYYDENMARQTKTFSLNLYVKKKADFETLDAGSDTFYANQNSKRVKILLKNTGTDAAYKARAKVLPQFPFSTDGSVRYAELIGVGKSEPIEFNVDIDKDATTGKYVLDMLVDFEDAQGKKLQDTAQLVMVVSPKGIFRKIFIDYWLLWTALLTVVGFTLRKKRHSNKKF